jgi:hypothetical protein
VACFVVAVMAAARYAVFRLEPFVMVLGLAFASPSFL